MKQRDYDSTVARIAGNLLSGFPKLDEAHHEDYIALVAREAVRWARAIVEETKRTTQEP